MFARWCVCVAAIATLPASALRADDIVVNDGDYYARLTVEQDGLVINGGQVDVANLRGQGTYELNGGRVGIARIATGEEMTVRGGRINAITRTSDFGDLPRVPVTIEGGYFRVHDQGLRQFNAFNVEGWLADGSFLSTVVINDFEGEAGAADYPVNIRIIPMNHPAGDANRDWEIDLEDFNTVRNNFGGPGEGDLDGNGRVDLDDLNEVRNAFGVHVYVMREGNSRLEPYVEVTTDTTFPLPAIAVPEPTSLSLALMGLTAGVVARLKRRHLNKAIPFRRLSR